MLQNVEKSLLASDLGITPVNDGKVIRLTIPELTEDRRKDIAKNAKKYGEDARIRIRQIRKDANDIIKERKKSKEISEDDEKRELEAIQKVIDKATDKVTDIVTVKEKEIMEV